MTDAEKLLGNDSPQLDVFYARPAETDLLSRKPGNFGSMMVCRTGSKGHNIYLVQHAKRIGLKWSPYDGVFNEAGQCLGNESEEDVFAALGLEWIAPERRER